MTRSYWVVYGEEITTSFSTEGTLVFSMDEMYYGTPSEEYVEAVEPVKSWSISIDELRQLITSDIDLCNWWCKYTRTNTGAYTVRTKSALHCPPRKDTGSSHASFPMCAAEPDLRISHRISESHRPH